ncbi:MAG TPA: MFS transporter, partial [Pseudomonadales bacterium]|nr:MFS transporter [Pseudomonadales bacterium]
MTAAVDSATLRRVSRRLIPFLFLLYVAAYLDRINVGFAQLQMKSALGFGDAVYGLGAGIFFVGYFLFEVPSNLVLARVGARVWIARIMITWGLISGAMAFVETPTGFYALRFLLGAAEAGFFPGVIYYLGLWFPARERAAAVSRFMTATAIAGVIGAPLSAWLFTLDGVYGFAGWQWIFLTEAVPSLALGVAVLFYLTDRPDAAAWLSGEQR